ncbi:hypothetical protein BDAP_000642 [Binucleata daphniae]
MSLNKMIKKIIKSNNEYKIVFFGLDNAGKTTVLHKVFDMQNDRIEPTFGYKIYTKIYTLDNTEYKINILDVGGQESLRKYWYNFFEKVNGIVFVTDCCDNRSYVKYLDEIQKENSDVPILILGNKSDTKNETVQEEISVDENIKYYTCSAKTGYKIKESFDWLICKIKENKI